MAVAQTYWIVMNNFFSCLFCFKSTNISLKWTQEYLHPDSFVNLHKKKFIYMAAILGGLMTLTELFCYISIYLYAKKTTNNVGGILRDSVIRERNKGNAISLYGQIATWFIEFYYVFLVGFFVNYFNGDVVREITPILKHFDFVLVPLVQVYTTPPLKKHLMSSNRSGFC